MNKVGIIKDMVIYISGYGGVVLSKEDAKAPREEINATDEIRVIGDLGTLKKKRFFDRDTCDIFI